MTTIIKYFAIALIFTALGYFWAFQSYQPLKLAQENQELQAKYQALNRAYTREFSKDFLEVKK